MKEHKLSDAINCSIGKNYTSIPNEIIRTSTLSAKAKTILFTLLSNKEGWKSYKTSLGKYMKEGETAINAGLKELEKNGYLLRIRYRDKKTKKWVGSFWAYGDKKWQFDVTQQFKYLEENNLAPHYENPHVGELHVGNQVLIILINNNTKINNKYVCTEKVQTDIEEKEKIETPPKKEFKRTKPSKKKTIAKPSKKKTIAKPSKSELNKPFLPLANQLKEIVQTTKNIQITTTKLNAWCDSFRLLNDKSRGEGVSMERIEDAMDWYESNVGGDFVPVIESGSTFRQKFTKLEAAIQRQKNPHKNKPIRNRLGNMHESRYTPETYGFRKGKDINDFYKE